MNHSTPGLPVGICKHISNIYCWVPLSTLSIKSLSHQCFTAQLIKILLDKVFVNSELPHFTKICFQWHFLIGNGFVEYQFNHVPIWTARGNISGFRGLVIWQSCWVNVSWGSWPLRVVSNHGHTVGSSGKSEKEIRLCPWQLYLNLQYLCRQF